MIYFSSDQHFGHNNVIKYCNRPFKDVEEMDEMLVKNWNDIIKPEDTVYILGDFSMSWNSAERIAPRLLGNKYLVPGNHDLVHSYHKKGNTEEKRRNQIVKYEDIGLNILNEQEPIILYGRKFDMCHHPYNVAGEDFEGDKYANWRPLYNPDRWLLCGHVHEKWKVKEKMINVGVDVWDYKPVSLKQIAELVVEHEKENIAQEGN